MAHVAIVGGGITGCIAALECADRGHTVDLFEMGSELGGIMRDVVHQKTHYFNGCHYFDRGTPWFEAIRPRLKCEFVDFVHEYGSFTDMLGQRRSHDDFAQPLFGGPTPSFDAHASFATVGDRLNAYPPAIARALREWSQGFGNPDALHAGCINAMQLGRVFFDDDVAGMVREKANNPVADELLGLPRTVRDPDTTKAFGSLPPGGHDRFFEALRDLLQSVGVRQHLSTPVAPLARPDGTISLRARGKPLEVDRAIFCCNPTALIIASGLGRLDSPVTNMFCLVGNLPSTPSPQTIYHQVFSDSSSVIRVFTYDLAGPKVTIEGFDRGQDDDDICRDAASMLGQLGAPGLSGTPKITRQKRYVNFTPGDLDLFERFEASAPALGIVPGGWQHYSRDDKLASIVSYIDDWDS